jgi:hypothetical protein
MWGSGHQSLTKIVHYVPIVVSAVDPASAVFISVEIKTCLRLFNYPRRDIGLVFPTPLKKQKHPAGC